MTTVDVVYGLLPDAEAAATVSDLEEHGIYESEIEVLVPQPGRYRLADEMLHEDASGARVGGLVGGLIGFAIGIALGLLPAIADNGAMVTVFTAMAAGGFGILIGAMIGLQRHEGFDDDPVRWRQIDDGEPVRLLAVHCLHWRNRAHHILERHGAVFLDSAGPVPS